MKLFLQMIHHVMTQHVEIKNTKTKKQKITINAGETRILKTSS